MYSRFKQLVMVPLQRFVGMALSWLGAMPATVVTAAAEQTQATESAFAAILVDGSVVTWGDADCGGDGTAVRDQLKNVQQIQATKHAFAAIRGMAPS